MNNKPDYSTYFFFVILIGVTVLGFFIIKPFLIPFIFALILVHLFNPLYKFLLKKTGKREVWSSLLVCILIALIIIIPVLIILALVINEVQGVVSGLAANPDASQKVIDSLREVSFLPFFQTLDLDKIFSQTSILTAAKNFSQWALVVLQGTYASVLNFVFVMFIMFFSLFYMFIDSEKLAKKVTQLFPLKDKYDKMLLTDLNSIIRATIKGTLVMAALQGFVSTILFLATGVSSPIFLGVLAAVASVIPSVGSGLVWLPVGVIMILSGHLTAGIAILLTGVLVVSTLDNLLRPKLVGRDTQMHPLFILFSTLGGIALFGLSGFIVGPIIISVVVALWNIYILEFKK